MEIMIPNSYSGIYVIKDANGKYYNYSLHKWGEFIDATIFNHREAMLRLDNLRKERECFLSEVMVREV